MITLADFYDERTRYVLEELTGSYRTERCTSDSEYQNQIKGYGIEASIGGGAKSLTAFYSLCRSPDGVWYVKGCKDVFVQWGLRRVNVAEKDVQVDFRSRLIYRELIIRKEGGILFRHMYPVPLFRELFNPHALKKNDFFWYVWASVNDAL